MFAGDNVNVPGKHPLSTGDEAVYVALFFIELATLQNGVLDLHIVLGEVR
jgi:hypothetical protein